MGSVLTTDHDVKMEFHRWLDAKNLQLFDQWVRGEAGLSAEAPMVSDACANAFGNYMCTLMFPNCTYMPFARWPYGELYEKIYPCKEVCEEVVAACRPALTGWLPFDIRCDDYKTEQWDLDHDPYMKTGDIDLMLTAYERRAAGG